MEALQNFHLIRPLWLLAIMPLAWLCYCSWQHRQQSTGMEKWINQQFLQYLCEGKQQKPSRLPIIGLGLVWLCTTLALAGPTWERRQQPVYESLSAVIIVLDLSPSMMAEDIKPSRINRAHIKIKDFLNTRKDGLTALVVYSGEAFVVTPLTSDKKTIVNLLPTLTPGILPIPGSNVEMGIEVAKQLVQDAGVDRSSLLLLTDDIHPSAIDNIPTLLPNSMDLTILGIGTDAGAPIPYQGDFIKNDQGELIIAKRNSKTMQELAETVSGYYLPLQADGSDIDFFVDKLQWQFNSAQNNDGGSRNSDAWFEFGPSLLVLCLPLLALSFRKGWLLSVTFLSITMGITLPQPATANEEATDGWWQSLWLNSNQRGYEHWKKKQYEAAAEDFKTPQWQGSAQYKKGDYDAAVKAFAKDQSAAGDYNRGNAHAMKGELDQAIQAYNDALKKNPNLEKAKRNKAKLEEIKKQQEQQRQQEESESSEKNQQQAKNSQQSEKSNSNHEEQQAQEEPSDQQQSDENSQQEQQQQAQSTEEDSKNEQEELAQMQQNLSPEEQQALQQWLRKVPDDPSGLLKRKFQYEFQKRKELYQRGEWQPPKNNAHQRY